MTLSIPSITQQETPFYHYDLNLLKQTLHTAQTEADKYGYHLHYALKANNNPRLLALIKDYNFGADCVSGGEIETAAAHQFDTSKIFFAGVGKTDCEIKTALEKEIYAFNVESLQEIEIIEHWAKTLDKKTRIALRINPNINAHTHKYISTGMEENKFGIPVYQLEQALEIIKQLKHTTLIGLHFHIGSQITDLQIYKELCREANRWNKWFYDQGHPLQLLNLGGGLGINYTAPKEEPIPNFADYFKIIADHLEPFPNQEVHFELGRSIVAQCGSLVSKVLYLKETRTKTFAIIDAGMTDLLRPALYNAEHKIEVLKLTEKEVMKAYEIVGPICESSDYFAKNVRLPELSRGDYIVIKSVGAYGEVMTSNYNMRKKPSAYYSA